MGAATAKRHVFLVITVEVLDGPGHGGSWLDRRRSMSVPTPNLAPPFGRIVDSRVGLTTLKDLKSEDRRAGNPIVGQYGQSSLA